MCVRVVALTLGLEEPINCEIAVYGGTLFTTVRDTSQEQRSFRVA